MFACVAHTKRSFSEDLDIRSRDEPPPSVELSRPPASRSHSATILKSRAQNTHTSHPTSAPPPTHGPPPTTASLPGPTTHIQPPFLAPPPPKRTASNSHPNGSHTTPPPTPHSAAPPSSAAPAAVPGQETPQATGPTPPSTARASAAAQSRFCAGTPLGSAVRPAPGARSSPRSSSGARRTCSCPSSCPRRRISAHAIAWNQNTRGQVHVGYRDRVGRRFGSMTDDGGGVVVWGKWIVR